MTGVLAGALSVIIIVLPNPGGPQDGGQGGGLADGQLPGTAQVSPWYSPPAGGTPRSGSNQGGGGGLIGGLVGAVKLDGWKLTIPEASATGTAASVNPVNGAEPWLTRGDNGSVTFWAPVQGATTPNSQHARTELVSLQNFKAGAGPHTLRASVSVGQVPSAKQDIILGQIHGADDISSVPFVMLHYDAGQIRVVVKQVQSGSTSAKYPLIAGVPLNSPFEFTISDTGNGNLSFTATHGSDSRTATAAIPTPFHGATVRFQAGDYQQAESGGGGPGTASTGGDGARVTFFALDEQHGQGFAAP